MKSRILIVTLLLSFSATGMAHILGHEGPGFTAGLLHPVLGLDHLLSIFSLGLLSFRSGNLRQMLLAFLSAMAIGWFAIQQAAVFNQVETGVALSMIAIGFTVLLLEKFSTIAAIALALFTGGIHGHAHGTDYASLTQPLSYLTGFLLSSSAILLAGFVIAKFLSATRYLQIFLRTCSVIVIAIGASTIDWIPEFLSKFRF